MNEAIAHVEPVAEMHDGPTVPVEFHPLANLFPLLDGQPYWDLVADIRDRGIREPIIMLEGKILDGRNRYLAARECGRPYPLVQYEGDDPAAYVISLNLKRRHLTESQRAMVATKLAKLPQGRPSGKSAGLPTQTEMAEALNVSERSIRSAREVSEHGAPELVTAVETGDATVSAAAEVARLPEDVQQAIVGQGPDAIRDAASSLREASPEEKAVLREQVIEAARRGLRPAPAAKRRNPDHVPNPPFEAMAAVAGSCQRIIDKIAEGGPAFIISGFMDDAMRDRNVATFTAARDALNTLLEACRAE